MTFITPFGRFCFKRLPFGISSAPEIFQHNMTELLRDKDGVHIITDDILIHDRTMEEHDKRLEETWKLIEESGIKLNPGKCELRKSTIQYFGHIISDKEIQPSKNKSYPCLKKISQNDTIFRYICAEFSRSTIANVRTFEKGYSLGLKWTTRKGIPESQRIVDTDTHINLMIRVGPL